MCSGTFNFTLSPNTAAAVGFLQLWFFISPLTQLPDVNQMLVKGGQLHALCCLSVFLAALTFCIVYLLIELLAKYVVLPPSADVFTCSTSFYYKAGPESSMRNITQITSHFSEPRDVQ